ncbi:MAG: DNA/RNA nuclease SfsA [Hyphomicrobiaceae bacterium]|nr:DNA/RNA nuclease SfsA [Hyphomicrobiaceae bacterium]
MNFAAPLISATLVKRYKRFLADVILENGDELTVHCANPGAMEGLNTPGIKVWLSKSDNPKRKLSHSWELAQVDSFGEKIMVGINTMHPNKLAFEAIQQGRIPELAGYNEIKKEVRYGENSRIDLLLSKTGADLCYVEVKNVHLLRQQGLAEFPDSVTKRGAKHLHELSNMVQEGHRAVMFYIVQRDDCQKFTIAGDKDPNYAKAFEKARQTGVEAIVYDCSLTPQKIEINHRLELAIPIARKPGTQVCVKPL